MFVIALTDHTIREGLVICLNKITSCFAASKIIRMNDRLYLYKIIYYIRPDRYALVLTLENLLTE